MAVSISAPTGVQFSESPVVVTVTIAGNTFPTQASMRRCVLVVKCENKELEFGWDADNGESYPVDVSSAIRAFLPDYDTIAMLRGGHTPVKTCSFATYITYLQNGDYMGGRGTATTHPGTLKAILGGLSDMDRIGIGNDKAMSGMYEALKEIVLSKKPHTIEAVEQGMPYPTSLITENGVTVTDNTSDLGHVGTYPDKVRPGGIRVVKENMTTFCFRNTLGVPETVAARFLELEQVGIEGSEYSMAGNVGFVPAPKRVRINTDEYTQYEMSSGYVSREWARWWAYEFLQAREHWIRMNEQWWPVSITPKGNVTDIIDRAKPDMCHVDFTVKMAYSGMQGSDWMTKE